MVYYSLVDISRLSDGDIDRLRFKIKGHFVKTDMLKRRDSVAARALLCLLLKKQYNLVDFTVDCEENGKPFIVNSDIGFNLSHSGKYILCATGKEQVGCDIQEIKDYKPEIAKRFFTQAEYACLERSEKGALDFTRLWALKESVLKFSGKGISGGLDQYNFSEYYYKDLFTLDGLCFDIFEFENYVVSICSENGCVLQLNADIEDIINYNF